MNYTKFSGDAGHNAYPDTGANAIKFEDNLAKEIWVLVQQKLKILNLIVTDCTPYGRTFNSVSESLAYRCSIANSSGSQFHICIHFNCGGGHGVEVYAISAAGKEVAKRICNAIAELGYINRGVKDGSALYVLKNTSMPSILIECAFVDSQDDMNRYNADAMANAIVTGITGQAVQTQATIQQATAKSLEPYPTYDETVPVGPNIYQIPNMPFYIEKRNDGDMSIHLDRGNYITLRKGGAPEVYWNNNKGAGGSKRLF
jgi:N-acetylmuramoyl-L-alanine amidase